MKPRIGVKADGALTQDLSEHGLALAKLSRPALECLRVDGLYASYYDETCKRPANRAKTTIPSAAPALLFSSLWLGIACVRHASTQRTTPAPKVNQNWFYLGDEVWIWERSLEPRNAAKGLLRRSYTQRRLRHTAVSSEVGARAMVMKHET